MILKEELLKHAQVLESHCCDFVERTWIFKSDDFTVMAGPYIVIPKWEWDRIWAQHAVEPL